MVAQDQHCFRSHNTGTSTKIRFCQMCCMNCHPTLRLCHPGSTQLILSAAKKKTGSQETGRRHYRLHSKKHLQMV